MAGDEFKTWLKGKLRQLKIDESVFSDYILSILEDEDSDDNKKEALEGILGELASADSEKCINEILEKWNSNSSEPPKSTETNKKEITEDINVQLAKILESKCATSNINQKQLTAEEKRIKQQILAQYSETSVKAEIDPEDPEIEEDEDPDLVRNTNKADVQNLIKEKREQARIESQKKKEKDREDREKQKQLREEKKEKRKTIKQERKR